MDPAPYLIAPQAFGPADVAAIGDTFLVVARKYGYTPQFIDAYGVRMRDSDGALLDGTTSTATNPSHTYTGAGTYTASLTVTDDLGATGTAASTINVAVSPGVMRVTAIGLTAQLRAGVVTVNGTVTVRDSKNATASGAVVKITWTRPGGSNVTQTATTDSSGVARFTTSGARGTYTLRVNDVTKNGCSFDRPGSVLTKSIKK